MAYPFTLSLRYGPSPTTLTLSLPPKPWSWKNTKVGGSLTVDSGAVAVWIDRTDRMLAITARVRESEWAQFEAAIDFGVEHPGQLSISLTGPGGTFYPVYFVAPKPDEEYGPTRSETGDPSTLEFEMKVRRVDGGSWASLIFYAE
ncbi:MAG TPA: hypothetical protein VFJ16_31205 [Longimicrobium sp.]|nr:hypothetical protein [Longimicrobium sp.]